MTKPVPKSIKIVLALNCVALVGFALALWVQPDMTNIDVCMNYTQLDRAGVINQNALRKFDPSYGFTVETRRGSVPRYIAGPALQAQRVNALLGLALAAVNLVMVASFAFVAKRAASAKTAANEDQR